MRKLTTDSNRRATVPRVRIKKRPRGKPFEKGNTLSLPYRWKPGQSGNPLGRPQCKEISKALREILSSDCKLTARSGAEKIAREWYKQGLKGNIAALISLADRCEGRPAMAISIDGGQEDPIIELIACMHEQSRRIGPPEQIREVITDGQEA
jgi:hypothetical protein